MANQSVTPAPSERVAQEIESLASTMCEMAAIGVAADETIHSEHGPPCEFCTRRVRQAFAAVTQEVEARCVRRVAALEADADAVSALRKSLKDRDLNDPDEMPRYVMLRVKHAVELLPRYDVGEFNEGIEETPLGEFVERDEVLKVIDAAPDERWQVTTRTGQRESAPTALAAFAKATGATPPAERPDAPTPTRDPK